jgi:ribonuclease P protein component
LAQSAGKSPRAAFGLAAKSSRTLRILDAQVGKGPVVSYETHLSAEEAQARTHSRISCSDEHASRPRRAQATSGQGPQATHRLMSARTTGWTGGGRTRPASRRGRLSRSADFDRVFRNGRSQAGRELVLYVFPRDGDDTAPRLGLSVSRKVGSAVERNRVKRLLREAFAAEGGRLAPGTDAVVIARPDAKGLAERGGLAGISRVLGELIERSSGGSPSTPATPEAPR